MLAINTGARGSLRTLLLPIDEQQEAQALDGALTAAVRAGVSEDDFPIAIRRELENWRNESEPTALLTKIAKAAICAPGDDLSALLSKNYFKMHTALQKSPYLLTFGQASALLCHSRLAVRLYKNNTATASQISLLLNARDSRTNASRQSVGLILRTLGCDPSVTKEMVLKLFERDADLSRQLLADASLPECSEIVGTLAEELGCGDGFSLHLKRLADVDDFRKFTPYLQTLHLQCTISEFYDTTITDLYEFSPRGLAAEALFEKYKQGMTDKGNPLLNNMKGVEQISLSWARARKPKWFPGAIALYSILDTLQSLGFSARRELSVWIRLWIHRVILLGSQNLTELPEELTQDQAARLIAFITTENTETSGVLEQRFVDAVSVVLHPDNETWKPRGLKDSVNATNISRKKLGDCDFQNSSEREVRAYEAHGGKLSKIYMEEHVRTLRRILPSRIEEWGAFSEKSDWNVEVVFVAHEIADDIEVIEIELDGIAVKIEATTYGDFTASVEPADLIAALDEFLLKVLAESRVPDSMREKTLKVIG